MTTKVDFIDKWLELEAEAGRVHRQERETGLRLIVRPSGVMTWIIRYWFERQTKFTIGTYPKVGLKEARRRALKAKAQIADGINPQAEKRAERAAKAAAEVRPDDIFEDVVKLFLKRPSRNKRERRPSTVREIERIVASDDLAKWRGQPLSKITLKEATARIDGIADRAPVMANRTLSVLSSIASFAVRKQLITVNVFEAVDNPGVEVARERVLDHRELAALLTALDDTEYPFGPSFKLLIMLGQRRGEVGAMRWSELDLDAAVWTLPRERTKNGVEHALPLPAAVVDILRELPRFEDSDVVFSIYGAKPAKDFAPAKKRIDAKMKETLGAAFRPWVTHDLRRTCATGMAEIGVPPHVVEAVLNHKSGTIRGIAKVYNRFSYQPEMRSALEAWSRRLAEIASGEKAAGNVVHLQAQK